MGGVTIETLSNQCWALTNPGGMVSTPTYPVRPPTILPPDQVTLGVMAAGDGVIPFGGPVGAPGAQCPGSLLLLPFAVGSPGQAFGMAVFGWTPTPGSLTPRMPALWIPTLISVMSCTIDLASGSDVSEVPSNRLFANAIAITFGSGTALSPGGANTAVPNP